MYCPGYPAGVTAGGKKKRKTGVNLADLDESEGEAAHERGWLSRSYRFCSAHLKGGLPRKISVIALKYADRNFTEIRLARESGVTLDKLWFVAFNISPHTQLKTLCVRKKTSLYERLFDEAARLGHRLKEVEALDRGGNTMKEARRVVAAKYGWLKEWEQDVPTKRDKGETPRKDQGGVTPTVKRGKLAKKKLSYPSKSDDESDGEARARFVRWTDGLRETFPTGAA